MLPGGLFVSANRSSRFSAQKPRLGAKSSFVFLPRLRHCVTEHKIGQGCQWRWFCWEWTCRLYGWTDHRSQLKLETGRRMAQEVWRLDHGDTACL